MLFFARTSLKRSWAKIYSFCDGRRKGRKSFPWCVHVVGYDGRDRGVVSMSGYDRLFFDLSVIQLTAVKRLLSSMIPVGSNENGIIYVNPKQIMAFLISAEMN
jgi:hypothetical protein